MGHHAGSEEEEMVPDVQGVPPGQVRAFIWSGDILKQSAIPLQDNKIFFLFIVPSITALYRSYNP